MISGKAGQSVLTSSFMTSCRFYITRSPILYIITRKCSEFAPGFISFASHCKVFRPKCNKSRKKHYICNPLWLDHCVNVATLAQLVEQRIRNAQVEGSNPLSGSKQNRLIINNLIVSRFCISIYLCRPTKKWCKYRPNFTRFVSKMIIGVKKASFLHRITVTCKENNPNTTTPRKSLQGNLSRMRCEDYNLLYLHLYQVLRRRDKALRISWKPMSWELLHQRKHHRP